SVASRDRPAGARRMDLKVVREEAIEATNRAFWDRSGFVPDEDSDEWEDEYRRQFDLAKKRHATQRPADVQPIVAVAPPEEEPGWAALAGPPTQIRWAAALRADRLKEIRDPGIREWLATTWTRSKSWIDTSSLPTAIYLQRIEPHYAQYRRQADERARLLAAEQQAKAAAADQSQARGARYRRAQPARLRDRRSGGADGSRKGGDGPERLRDRARRGARRGS